ncbi:MAG: inositol monophosphatase [Clostridia bacterium]|nr:inositol monophosphatase [Clostridia bacterium]
MKETNGSLLAALEAVVRRAGALAREKTLQSSVHIKGSNDFVTDADLAVSDYLTAQLPALIEDSRVLSEEDAEKTGIDGKVFIIDPIDGTTNLMYGMNMSVVSVGYCEDGVPMLAAAYQPFTDEMFTAERGKGAYLNGQSIHVNADARVCDALIGIETGPATRMEQENFFKAMFALQKESRGLRLSGSAALDFCYVACGRLSAAAYHYLYPWDFAAGMLLVAEAGGRVTLMDGSAPVLTGRSKPLLSSNARIHEELLAAFAGI